jgi:hypothetical protein
MAMHTASSTKGQGRGMTDSVEDWRSGTGIEDHGGVKGHIEQKPKGKKKGTRKRKGRRKENRIV